MVITGLESCDGCATVCVGGFDFTFLLLCCVWLIWYFICFPGQCCGRGDLIQHHRSHDRYEALIKE